MAMVSSFICSRRDSCCYFEAVAAAFAGKASASRASDLTTAFATVRAVKSAPNANLMTGPKLIAAASPTKYRPGTDDSNDEDSAGDPTTVLILERVLSPRNFSFWRSTL